MLNHWQKKHAHQWEKLQKPLLLICSTEDGERHFMRKAKKPQALLLVCKNCAINSLNFRPPNQRQIM